MFISKIINSSQFLTANITYILHKHDPTIDAIFRDKYAYIYTQV
jgi:hypothetical protein